MHRDAQVSLAERRGLRVRPGAVRTAHTRQAHDPGRAVNAAAACGQVDHSTPRATVDHDARGHFADFDARIAAASGLSPNLSPSTSRTSKTGHRGKIMQCHVDEPLCE